MKSKRVFAALLVVAATLAIALPAAADADADAIRQAVLNYVNSAYEVNPALVEESVHPRLQKIGYVSRAEDKDYSEHWMNFEQLKELVTIWNKEGRFEAKTAKREIQILDQLDRIAVARLEAEWGIDFFHLAKIDGKWMIMNVIWQTYPPQAATGSAGTK